ncbi:hypothetical protein [Bacillus sp. CGMCC 1.16541]|nr:hypothetical protein [Bacillus sp. CGMCC 1.16541]
MNQPRVEISKKRKQFVEKLKLKGIKIELTKPRSQFSTLSLSK